MEKKVMKIFHGTEKAQTFYDVLLGVLLISFERDVLCLTRWF
jgi:hypothetical protein